jgi:putative tryptophan/tyrosine transport system substrate-binding protein
MLEKHLQIPLSHAGCHRLVVRLHGERVPADAKKTSLDIEFAERADALFLLSDTMFFVERRRIAGLAEKARLPAMYHWRAYVGAGGLMSYGPNLTELYRRAAYFVDRILKGATPVELPVEQPTKFELIINSASRES